MSSLILVFERLCLIWWSCDLWLGGPKWCYSGDILDSHAEYRALACGRKFRDQNGSHTASGFSKFELDHWPIIVVSKVGFLVWSGFSVNNN